jgi:hypothetical protein
MQRLRLATPATRLPEAVAIAALAAAAESGNADAAAAILGCCMTYTPVVVALGATTILLRPFRPSANVTGLAQKLQVGPRF